MKQDVAKSEGGWALFGKGLGEHTDEGESHAAIAI